MNTFEGFKNGTEARLAIAQSPSLAKLAERLQEFKSFCFAVGHDWEMAQKRLDEVVAEAKTLPNKTLIDCIDQVQREIASAAS